MRLEFYEQSLLFIRLPANGLQSRRIRRIVVDPLLVAGGRDCQNEDIFLVERLGGTSRSEFLNWSERETWNRWSVGPPVFGFYSFFLGPQPFRLESCLPLVLVFRRHYWPTAFSFSGLRTTELPVIDRLKQELEASRKSRKTDARA